MKTKFRMQLAEKQPIVIGVDNDWSDRKARKYKNEKKNRE